VNQGDHVLASTDDGATWQPRGRLPLLPTMSLSFDPVNPDHVMAATTNGVAFSADAGATWAVRNAGIHETAVGNFFVRHDSSNYVYAQTFDDQLVWRRSPIDGTWSGIASQAAGTLTPLSPSVGGTGFGASAVAPGTLYLIHNGRYGRSDDDGATWRLVGNTLNTNTLTLDPQDAMVAYIGGTLPGGARKTVDGGVHWTPLAGGLPPGVEDIVVNASNPQIVYAAMDYTSTLPAPIYKSADGGATWSPSATGVTDPFVWRLRGHPAEPATLFAAGQSGLWRTTDGGIGWKLVFGSNAADVAVDPAPPHALYVAANSSSLRSVDGGDTWEDLLGGEIGGTYASTVALAPEQSGRVLLAVRDRGIHELTIAPDLDLSTDAGELFVAVPRTVTMRVKNKGPFTATHVALVVQPGVAQYAYTAQSSTASCTKSLSTLTCVTDILRPGETSSVGLALTPDVDGYFVSMQVAANESDAVAANNHVLVATSRVNDIKVELAGSVATAQTGASYDYTLTLSNLGPSPSLGVQGLVTLPANVTYQGVTATGLSCAQAAELVTCRTPNLGAGASATAVISVKAVTAGTATATARSVLEPGGTDRVSGNDSASAQVTLTDPPPPASSSSGGSGSGSSSSSGGGSTSSGGASAGGGGKGGGGLDYLLLTFLLCTVAGRRWSARSC
jgi:uncharacterized repeat protein (TIGR01451 family)